MTPFAHQAGCVAIQGRGLLIEGAPGLGKSSLALDLIDRGAQLVGDDSLLLTPHGPHLFASPHPATRGLIEIRGVGLVPLPPCESVAIALILRLSPDAPRYIETAPQRLLGGISLPIITLWPDPATLPLRAEWALRRHGLEVPSLFPDLSAQKHP